MNHTQPTEKYGLLTAIAMVVGIVVGSGVFFKAEIIHLAIGGNPILGIAAWLIGGLVMLSCVLTFSAMSGEYESAVGIVGYAEATMGEKYAYYVGWFMATLYYPTITSVVAWLSARYTMVLFGSTAITGGASMLLSCLYLVGAFALNCLSPRLAGKFQVSVTFVKLIPLALMAVVGTLSGLFKGTLSANFSLAAQAVSNPISRLFTAVIATAFAYEGWIVATGINSELKNPKRNLPLALITGSLIVISVYTFYYIGLTGAIPSRELMENGSVTIRNAFVNLFGFLGGGVFTVFITLSCLGALNGMMLGCSRGMYALSLLNRGPKPSLFHQLDPATNMPMASAVLGLLFSIFWLFFYYGSALSETPFWGHFSFDSSELPIVTTYALYIPLFLRFMVTSLKKGRAKHFLLALSAVIASLFMTIAAAYAHPAMVVPYLISFAVIMAIGALFSAKKSE